MTTGPTGRFGGSTGLNHLPGKHDQSTHGKGGGAGGWKPTMTREEADAWAADSKIQYDLFHGTTPEAAAAIRENGFDIDEAGSQTDKGNLGQGVYFSPAQAMAYGGAQGYGETLTVRARIDSPLMTSSQEYARQYALSGVVDVRATMGGPAAESLLDGPASTSPTAGWKPPSGMTNRELIGAVDDGQMSSLVDAHRSGGNPAVVRQIALDNGNDAVVWEFPDTALPDRPAGAEHVYEVVVYDERAITVVSGSAEARLRWAVRNIDPTAVNLDTVQRDFERRLNQLLDEWVSITADQRNQILDQVRFAITSDDLAALTRISVSTTAAAEALTDAMADMALQAARRVVEEAEEQDVRIDPVASDTATFAAMSVVVAALLGQGLTNAAAREAARRWSPTTTGDDVASAVGEHLESLSDSFVAAQLGGALTSAQNTGRLNTMLAGPSAALYASEQMDGRTCTPCSEINGKWIGNSDEPDIVAKVEAVYPNGGYRDCEGGVRCHGTIVQIFRPAQVARTEQ